MSGRHGKYSEATYNHDDDSGTDLKLHITLMIEDSGILAQLHLDDWRHMKRMKDGPGFSVGS